MRRSHISYRHENVCVSACVCVCVSIHLGTNQRCVDAPRLRYLQILRASLSRKKKGLYLHQCQWRIYRTFLQFKIPSDSQISHPQRMTLSVVSLDHPYKYWNNTTIRSSPLPAKSFPRCHYEIWRHMAWHPDSVLKLQLQHTSTFLNCGILILIWR